MEFYTQTVDSSLWASRAFDDEGYENDASAAKFGATAFELELVGSGRDRKCLEENVECVLLCTKGTPAVFAKAVLGLKDPAALLKSEGAVDVPVYFLDKFAVIALNTDVPPERSFEFAKCVFVNLSPSRLVVITTLPAWQMLAIDDLAALQYLATAKQPEEEVAKVAIGGKIQSPVMLQGIAAAMLNEAEWRRLPGAAIVGAEHSIHMAGANLAQFQPVAEKLVGLSVDAHADFSTIAETHFNVDKANIYL